MRLNAQEKNGFEALWQLVRYAKLKITATSLKATLLQSRDNNTIATFSDILNEYNVPNMVARLSPDQLHEIPLPAITFFEGNGGTFVTITKIEGNNIEWLHNQAGSKKESISNFSQHWTGITLMIEPNEKSGELNYLSNKKAEILENLRIPFILIGTFSILSFIIYNLSKQLPLVDNWQFYTLIISKSIGLVISIMLLWHSIDANNSFLKSICQLNEKTNCNNILNSKAAKLFGWLSWSEIGLFYFGGGLLALLLNNIETFIPILYLAALAIPYTVWSIYYQGFVAKEWCPMCLAIQLILIFEFIIFLKSDIIISNLQNVAWGNLFLTFLITPTFWAFIKKPFQKSMRTDSLYNEFQKMKFDSEYVQAFMSKQRTLPPIFEGMKVIEIGNSNAENELILVLSPNCASCRRTYWTAKNLLEINENIKIKIILAASLNTNDDSGMVSRLILSQTTESEIADSLEKWFSNDKKNIRKWSMNLKIKEENEEGLEQMGLHLRWLNLASVSEAPATFLNKTEIPKQYLSSELMKLLNISQQIGFANQV